MKFKVGDKIQGTEFAVSVCPWLAGPFVVDAIGVDLVSSPDFWTHYLADLELVSASKDFYNVEYFELAEEPNAAMEDFIAELNKDD